MSDQESTTTEPQQSPATDAPDVQADPTPEPAPPQPQKFDADYVAKLRAEAAKYRNQAKENAAAAARLTEIEDAQKSEAEKLQAKLDAAEQRATAAEQARLRAEIAQTKGVPADLLAGGTEEELTASAERLLAFRGQQPAPEYGRGTDAPPTKPRQLTKADMASMSAADIVKADEAGLFADLKAGRK
jgi:hypothetical protein